MLDRRGRFGHGAEYQSETPDTSVGLGVAIRAKHDAAHQLLSDLLPWSIDAVDGDREFLLVGSGRWNSIAAGANPWPHATHLPPNDAIARSFISRRSCTIRCSDMTASRTCRIR